ncbi:DUF4350 domain-containing protein [Novosphingobium aquiterrae]|uniref:DUF4350 domain-containing protein n=1 Tax=Novosphingobium aquiterrae TaxID=624388 RepID=A0ABV6PG59_9SPHN
MSDAGRSTGPFSPRMALALVAGGIALFLLVLWMIGSGMSERKANNGGAHAAAKGLTGYAAFAQYIGKRGYPVALAKSPGALHQPGTLVLTPPAYTDTAELSRIVQRHRSFGPTIVVLPKWGAFRLPRTRPDVKEGWVELGQPLVASWKGFYDDITLSLDRKRPRQITSGWVGAGLAGPMPAPGVILSGSGPRLVPLVETAESGQVLAAYVADGGDYPGLRDMATRAEPEVDEDETHGDYPVVFIFDPDLIDNYGLANPTNALLGERLLAAAIEGDDRRVVFDLTLNGLGRSRSLLTLAFEPPFLAATLCLMLAALVLGWRAFNRFGPPLLGTRALAFGKRALVSNAAGLIRRTRRMHLIGGPYADAARDRLTRALALPARLSGSDAEAAIDRALVTRDPQSPAFSATAAALRTARRPIDMLRAARTLHLLERTLTK